MEWLSPVEARVGGMGQLLDEVEEVLGVVESVWRCPACGECGFFGPTESGAWGDVG